MSIQYTVATEDRDVSSSNCIYQLQYSGLMVLSDWGLVQMICTCFRVPVPTTAMSFISCCRKTQNCLT